mmetsp:Transcript_56600/g.120179  ORF Transcript_56600/g.120179 Transcript_56600/m.120179 type:complete len:258 (+) Transcript_56600:85-858(+)
MEGRNAVSVGTHEGVAELSKDGRGQVVQDAEGRPVTAIPVKVSSVEVAVVVDGVDGVVVLDGLDPIEPQPLVQPDRPPIVRDDVQVQRPAILPLPLDHIRHPLHQDAPQPAPPEFRAGAQSHYVEHSFVAMEGVVGDEEGGGGVAGGFFVQRRGVAGGGHGRGEEGAHDAPRDSLSVVVVVRPLLADIPAITVVVVVVVAVVAVVVSVHFAVAARLLAPIESESVAVKSLHPLLFGSVVDRENRLPSLHGVIVVVLG